MEDKDKKKWQRKKRALHSVAITARNTMRNKTAASCIKTFYKKTLTVAKTSPTSANKDDTIINDIVSTNFRKTQSIIAKAKFLHPNKRARMVSKFNANLKKIQLK